MDRRSLTPDISLGAGKGQALGGKDEAGAAGELGLDEAEFAQRKAYLELGEADAERLRGLAAEVAGSEKGFVEGFYGWLLGFGETSAALARASVPLDTVRSKHGEQLSALLTGSYDFDYALTRMRIGVAHHRVGLEPEWYIGAYRHHLTWLLPAAWRAAKGDADAFLATAHSLVKVVLLDIELVISAYFHADHEKLRLFAKVFESDLEAVLITDPAGGIVHASHMTGSISGYRPAELFGRNIELLHSARNPEPFQDIWREVVEFGEWRGDVWHRHPKGRDYLARMNVAAVRNDDRQATHYVVEYSDVTNIWQAEQALKSRTEELARSNKELEQFAYVASHDLQEPLRMVASYTQLLARRYKGKLDQDADEFIAYAVDGATRMQGLINDLLKFSRVGTRGKPFAPTDCERVLNAALANLDLAIRESWAALTRDPMPALQGDETQLVQLFQNLIGNAIKFRAPGEPPRIHVGARRVEGAWEFSVQDNGIGISPEYFERIFVIFQRLHGKADYPGTGIGLAICKKIVERHSGRLWVESRPGEGATFLFTIPDRKATDHEH